MIKFSTNLFRNLSTRSLITKKRSRPYLLLAFPISAFGLGIWQIRRREWKIDIIKHIDSKLKADPIDLTLDISLANLPEYTVVKARGVFEHEKEVYLGPRNLIEDFVTGHYRLSRSQSSSKVGYNVVTPFRVAGSSVTILVNRGWVPADKIDPSTRQNCQPDGIVEVEGIVRKSDERSTFQVADNVSYFKGGFEKLVFNRKDIDEMSRIVGTSEFLVDIKFDKSVAAKGGPIGGQTRVNIRNEHMQYIITWFSLGVALSLMWIVRYR